MIKRETSAEIEAIAADWAVRIDRAPLDPQEADALGAWLSGDSRRLGAYARARAMYAHARRAKALGADFDPDRYLAAEANEGIPSLADAEAPPGRPSRRRVMLMGGSAVAAGILATVGISWQAAAQTYRTRRGEIRLVPLADGSSITLNTASEISVAYDEDRRQVTLVEGEVFFDVVTEHERPFIVLAGDMRVRAIGTSFAVRRIADAPVQVMVRQGVVEVFRPSGPSANAVRISANSRAVATAQAEVVAAPITPAEVGRDLAWREGMLAFEDTPLDQAAREFARYSDVRIQFEDPTIASETVTGLYAANNPAGFARAVALSLGLRAEPASEGIVLRR